MAGLDSASALLGVRWAVTATGSSLYDALIVAAALPAGYATLQSEDLQDGQLIDQQLTIRNPAKAI